MGLYGPVRCRHQRAGSAMTMMKADELVPIKGVVQRLGISDRDVYRIIDDGGLPARRTPEGLAGPAGALDEYAANHLT